MSSIPLRPPGHPQRPASRHSSSSQQPLSAEVTGASSGSSSVTAASQPSRADQVVYRFYVKTVSVLVEARLTHYADGVGKSGEKKDKWVSYPVDPCPSFPRTWMP